MHLGTIAVVDTQPRSFSDGQRDLLRDLSSLVITTMENRQRINLLGHQATTDYLTGLANRAQFERTLISEIAHMQRTGQAFTILYMDLDDFKIVNDSIGHAAGDEVLCEVADRMSMQLRAGDVLARLGGDEFGVIMRQATRGSIESLVDRIVRAVSMPIGLTTGKTVSIGISVGIAPYTDATDSMATLLARADQALYDAKRKKQSGMHITSKNNGEY